jgi:hypothetical protein
MQLAAANDHLLAAPGEPLSQGRLSQVPVSANDEQSNKLHLSNSEALCDLLSLMLLKCFMGSPSLDPAVQNFFSFFSLTPRCLGANRCRVASPMRSRTSISSPDSL